MPKKIFIILTFTIGVAIVALLSATVTTAQTCPEPSASCQTPDGWTITLVDIDEVPIGGGDCAGQWKYTYEVCKPGTGGNTGVPCESKGLSHVNLAIPDCCPNEIILNRVGNDSLQTYDVGEGDPTTNFELGDLFVYVAKFTLQKSADHKWSFCANTGVTAGKSVQLKIKNALEGCKILTPACPPPPDQPRFNARRIKHGEVEFDILFDLAGDSYAVDCVFPPSCEVTDVDLGDLRINVVTETPATVIHLPFEKPFQGTASPGCTYVRTRSGGVKKVCP